MSRTFWERVGYWRESIFLCFNYHFSPRSNTRKHACITCTCGRRASELQSLGAVPSGGRSSVSRGSSFKAGHLVPALILEALQRQLKRVVHVSAAAKGVLQEAQQRPHCPWRHSQLHFLHLQGPGEPASQHTRAPME